MQIEDVTPKALIAKPETIEAKVAEWSATDADLHAAVEATKGLTVKGHAEGPKKGREAVHKALMTLADCRVSIEKRREELKRPIIDLGKLVDSEAKRLTAITAPREAELRTDRDAYDAEEAKAKVEAERIAREAKEAEERKAREEQVKRDEEERIRQAEIAERNRLEAQRLADEREAFERQQREAREAQERIDTARRKQEAEEQAKREAEAEAERIAAAQAEAEAIRAAQAPDREKVAAWAKVVRGSIAPCPAVDSAAVREQMLTARIAVEEILNRLEREMLEA